VLGVAAAFVGAVLTCFNLYGLGADARQQLPGAAADAVIPHSRIAVRKHTGESDRAFFRRATNVVHDRIIHGDRPYVVPAHENWILHAASYALPAFSDFEYSKQERAFERGVGLCTQYVAAVFDVLQREGYDPRAVVMRRHSIVAVSARSGSPFLLDADFDVVMDMSLREVRMEPARVHSFYSALTPTDTPHPSWTPTKIANEAERAFGGELFGVLSGDPTPQRARAERIAYLLKWPLPAGMLLIGGAALTGLGLMPRRLRRKGASRQALERTAS